MSRESIRKSSTVFMPKKEPQGPKIKIEKTYDYPNQDFKILGADRDSNPIENLSLSDGDDFHLLEGGSENFEAPLNRENKYELISNGKPSPFRTFPTSLSFTGPLQRQYPDPIPFSSDKLIPVGQPRGYQEIDFAHLRHAAIRREVKLFFEELRTELKGGSYNAYREAERIINWNPVIAATTALLLKQGKFWDKPKRQEFLQRAGWWVLKLAQITEIFYTAGGVALSFFGVTLVDPVFWMGIVPTMYAGLGTLVMNVSLVDPDTEVSEVICPDHLLIDHQYFKTNYEIKFRKPLLNKNARGFKNEFHAEYFNRCLGPVSAQQADYVLPLLLRPIEWLVILINNIVFHLNNAISPSGNWIVLPAAATLIATQFFNHDLSTWDLIKIGIPTFLFVEAVDAGYYVALAKGPKDQADEDTCTSRNPVIRAFKIEWLSALRGLLEYIKNAVLRGVTVAGCVSAAIEYMHMNELIDEDILHDMKKWGTLIVFIVIALNTVFTRHRAFDKTVAPCLFTLPTTQELVVTDSTVLDYDGVRASVRDAYSAKDMSSLIKKAILYGACDALGTGMVLFNNYDFYTASISTVSIFSGFTLLYYYSAKRTLINQRARYVLDDLCGAVSTGKPATEQLKNLVFWVVFHDAIVRAISRIGGLRGFLSDFDEGTLGLSNMSMYFAFLAWTISGAIPEALFFEKLMKKNGPSLITFVQDSAEKSAEGEENGCLRRANRMTAKVMLFLMPAWFQKDQSSCSQNTLMSYILPCCFRKKKSSTTAKLDRAINSSRQSAGSHLLYSTEHGRSEIGAALGRAKTAEKNQQEMCMVM